MNFRKAAIKDIKACSKLSRVPQISYAYKSSDKENFEYFKLFLEKGFIVVAEHENEVIGFACAEKMYIGDFAWIDAIVVKKDFRGKGAGRGLFNKLKDEIKKEKIGNVYLVAPTLEKSTIEFYESLGFKRGNKCIEFYKEL